MWNVMPKAFKRLLLVAAAMTLSACGGGGGTSLLDSGTTSGGTTTSGTQYSIELLASKTQVGTNDSTGVDVIAYVKDANNNLVSGVPVTISTTDGNLSGAPFTTDSSGTAKGTLTTTQLYANGQITLNASAGGSSAQPLIIGVTGTSIGFNGSSTAAIGGTQTYSVTLTDSNGLPIANKSIDLSATSGTLSAATVTTDSNGTATFDFTAGSSNATITASSSTLNATASKTITVSTNGTSITTPAQDGQILNINTAQTVTAHVTAGGVAAVGATVNFTATRGTLSASSAVTNGSGDATVTINSTTSGPALISATANGITANRNVSFTAPTAQKVIVQANSSVIDPNGSTQVQALVQDNNGNAVVNATVDFLLENETSGGQLSAASATTNSQGVATVTYTAGPNTDNAFDIRATDRATGVNGVVNLSVAGKSFSVILGTDNKIQKDTATATYQKVYNVIVTDNTGAPIANAPIQIRALPQQYQKGVWVNDGSGNWTQNVSATCGNEDINHNGTLDPGEDTNNNGTLQPGNVVTFSPANPVTNSSGLATVTITYGETYAQWVNIDLSATATVSGTEGTNTLNFWLPIDAQDVTSNVSGPAGNPSPFGTASICSNPN